MFESVDYKLNTRYSGFIKDKDDYLYQSSFEDETYIFKYNSNDREWYLHIGQNAKADVITAIRKTLKNIVILN